MNQILSAVIALALAFGGGYWLALKQGEIATAEALAKAQEDNRIHNDEVVNGWARSVDYLRSRLRAGDVPRFPRGMPAETVCPLRPDGGPADGVPAAGELATCRAERARLIEDCALTTIQLKGLQDWAR